MAFCRECGTQIADDDMFCPNCGTPREDIPEQPDNDYSEPSQDSNGAPKQKIRLDKGAIENKLGSVKSAVTSRQKPGWIKIALICAAAIVVALILIFAFAKGGGKAYQAPIKTTLNVLTKKQFNKSGMKTILQTLPPDVLEYLLDQENCDDIDELLDDNEDMYEDMEDELEDYKITYEMKDSKQLKKKEVRDLEEKYEDYYDVDMKIDDGYTTKVKLKADDGDGDKQKTTMEITTIKVKGKWYLDYSSFGSIMSF
ncbi:MAG: zinc-ribbon domain-containing protein [Lachnospiraceae bacterium]|nr:zinc-ribbon domain-containing protein [Lachnospiraceae bacterium]